MKRTQNWPTHVDPAGTLSKSPPVPKPAELTDTSAPAGEADRPDPTRYGDWEKKGIAVDF